MFHPDPFQAMSWRRFVVLLGGLSPEATFRLVRQGDYIEDSHSPEAERAVFSVF